MKIDYDEMTIPEATQMQYRFREKLILHSTSSIITTIGGADISFNKNETTVYAGIVLLSFPGMHLISCALAKAEVHFPYVSGYLAFREVPALLKAWEMLSQKPDLLVVDGNGIVHPRRMGIASHFGILTDQSTMGIAKTLLYGKYKEPDLSSGSASPIMDKKEQIGWALRSKNAVSPIFVSPGHRQSLEDSLKIATQSLGRYRIPEPTRQAHEMVNKFRTGQIKEGAHTFPPSSILTLGL